MSDYTSTWASQKVSWDGMDIQPTVVQIDQLVGLYRDCSHEYRGIIGWDTLELHAQHAARCLQNIVRHSESSVEHLSRPTIKMLRDFINIEVSRCSSHLEICKNILGNILDIHENG